MTILGVDYGEKRIGLALADKKSGAIWPYEVLANTGSDSVGKRLHEVVALEDVVEVVVGIPLTLSGSEGASANAARKFGKFVAAELKLPVDFVDERFTSAEASRMAKEYGSKELDAVSAALILKTYLEKTQNAEHETQGV